MSSEIAAGNPVVAEEEVAGPSSASVDDEAYEPTYAEAFPPLPVPEVDTTTAAAKPKANPWASTNKFTFKRSNVTQVFCVPLEERRFKEINEQAFGDQAEQAKICGDIMNKTGVSIEMSSAKDKSLTVVITGKGDSVMKARKYVVQQLQTQARATVRIPKEHYGYILGPKGKKLTDLELDTATKITVPRPDENSEFITIMGTKEGIEKARHEIQIISDEQAKLAFERLNIEKCYHPFILGPDQVNIKALAEQTGAKISVPPPSVQKDEIVVSGEKEGVHQAIESIMKTYKEKKTKCQTVSVEVRKSQHKYVIGQRGAGINEILATTGVSVEVPALDNPSETITLRGGQGELGPALTAVYSKANSVVIGEVEAPAWLHRFIIGRKGANINKITQEFSKVHIEFQDGQDKIELEGPPDDVEQAKKALDDITKDLLSRMSYGELDVPQKYHKHIIGRQGSNVGRIKEETGVSIRIPPDGENSNVIRIEGSPEGVEKAKKELMEMVHKMENEKSRDIMIEQRFHKNIIGAQGQNIREIRDRFNQVQITFPEPGKKSEVVTLRGSKNDVDKAFRYLQQTQQDMADKNFVAEVHIFKDFHKNIIGKGGATIRKIRDETETRIDLPSENSDSDVITITGRKANVEQAKNKIEAIQKDLANIKEVSIEIPNKFHNTIIGAKGRLIKSVMDECGGVIIRFPAEGTNSDKVTIRGPKDDVEKAKKQLIELANERKEHGHTVEINAKSDYHKFLIGKGGSNVRALRESTGARVIFPASNDHDSEIITIMGTKDAVEAAKKDLESRIKSLDNIVEAQITVDPKYHRHFVVRRGEVLRGIADEFGGVSVSFPRSGMQSDKVTLKGAKDCVEGAKKRIGEIVADLEAQVTIECVIPQVYHRTVMGPKGSKVQQITQEHDVNIKFPDRPNQQEQNNQQEGEVVNGDATENGDGDKPRQLDIIIITGKRENCDAASAALLALVPIEKEVSVPIDYHRFIIGQGGRGVRQMMFDNDVNISIPSPSANSEVITIKGAPVNVDKAEKALLEKVSQLDAEKEDRMARSFQLEVTVPPLHHPKIIGRKGGVISKIRKDHNVQIQFPERGAEREDVIIITGYEKDTEAAKDDIMAIVKDLEDQVTEECFIDHRVHPRIIGGRGRNVRKIMDQYKVDIKFPNQDAENPDLVLISGEEDAIFDCKDHLLNLEEEFLQDITDQELMKQYVSPRNQGADDGDGDKGDARGFVVRDAPWSHGAPDTSSTTDFPEFGASVSKKNPIVWGPRRN